MKIITADKLRGNWSLPDLAGQVVSGIRKDHCSSHAAEIAFFFLFALFPCLLTLTSLLAYLPVPDLVSVLLKILGNFIPDTVLALVEKNLQALVSVQKGGLLSFGVLLSLWTASRVVVAIQTSLNDAYETEDQRPYWQVRFLSALLVICFAFFIMASLLLLFFGRQIGVWVTSLAGFGHAFNLAWNLLRWPVIFALMMTALFALYRYAPALKLSWRETIPGAVTATGAWVVVSLAFSYYANNFKSYDQTYGSIGAVIALLFWLYASAFVILLGGEINARLREMRNSRR
ncbi:MAG: YihY/virulence factor BrkB family protein [Desulfuromonadales bacterium]|nr:YihY/virulence factor BrkB family protein [Desulfuromonadales bacterium]